MVCWCSLAGTTACKNCSRIYEFHYPEYVIDYSITNPIILQDNNSRIVALEHAIERLNEKIDKLLGADNETTIKTRIHIDNA